MKSTIEQFIKSKKIAIAGISSNKDKFGNYLFKDLIKKGYDVYPLSKSAEEIEGRECAENLNSIPSDVESLIISTNSDDAGRIIGETDASRIKRIWLVGKAKSEKNILDAEIKGLKVVHTLCPLMMFGPEGFHKFHSVIAKIFGIYPPEYKKEKLSA